MWRLVLLCLCLGTNVVGQSTQIDKVLAKSVFDHAEVGISVRSVSSGEEVYAYRSQKLMTPASTLKLITTLSAIDILGQNFAYQTEIYADGDISEDGTLTGNIEIVGSGDPTLGCGRFDDYLKWPNLIKSVTASIAAAGITCIDGDVIADPSIFPDQVIADQWNYNDIGNYYAAGAWGLNVNENLYHLYFKNTSRVGSTATVGHITPPINDIYITSKVKVASPNTGDQAYIYGVPHQRQRIVRGTIPQTSKRFSIKGSMPDPPLHMAQLLYDLLDASGIKVAGGYKVGKSKRTRGLYQVSSPDLQSIVTEANHHSINLYCDALLKTVGHTSRKSGTIASGLAAIDKHLESLGLPTDELIMKDGSGLASENAITARWMTAYLQKIQAELGKEVLSYLPRAGADGTVKNLLKGKSAAKSYYLKSGSIEGVQAYAGYVKAASGKSYSICIMVNNYKAPYRTMRAHIEQMLTAIQGEL